jgi:hypothetical protein
VAGRVFQPGASFGTIWESVYFAGGDMDSITLRLCFVLVDFLLPEVHASRPCSCRLDQQDRAQDEGNEYSSITARGSTMVPKSALHPTPAVTMQG